MRLVTVLFLLLPLVPAWAEDFRNAKFGMSPEEVRATESDADWFEQKGGMAFQTTLAGHDVVVAFVFVNDRLVRGLYGFTELSSNSEDYLRDFEQFEELLARKYGQPKESDTNWIDDQWKDRPGEHGYAIERGHMMKQSEWETESSLVIHAIYGEDYEIRHRIDYHSLELLGTESQKILEEL